MTTSFYIREHSNSNSASIYVRVNEGRYKQFRFATGNDLNKASSWNDNTQSVRTNPIVLYFKISNPGHNDKHALGVYKRHPK